MKNITIAGNIGKDAETRDAGQSRVTGWTVAVDDGWGDNRSTLWFDCNWWGQRGEKVARYIRKGGKITVAGELSSREHNGKTYLTVNVTDVTLQSKTDQGGGQYSNDSGSSGGYGGDSGGYGGSSGGGGYGAGGGQRSDLDDDLPF